MFSVVLVYYHKTETCLSKQENLDRRTGAIPPRARDPELIRNRAGLQLPETKNADEKHIRA